MSKKGKPMRLDGSALGVLNPHYVPTPYPLTKRQKAKLKLQEKRARERMRGVKNKDLIRVANSYQWDRGAKAGVETISRRPWD